MTQGRKEEAIKELQRAARVNGRTVPEDQLDKVICIKHTLTKNIVNLSMTCTFSKTLFTCLAGD